MGNVRLVKQGHDTYVLPSVSRVTVVQVEDTLTAWKIDMRRRAVVAAQRARVETGRAAFERLFK